MSYYKTIHWCFTRAFSPPQVVKGRASRLLLNQDLHIGSLSIQGMDKSSMQLGNCLVHPSMQWFQSAVVQLCGVQDCLLHVTEALTRQLCASARQFLETLDGGPLTAELVERAGGQTALLETLLSRYDPSRNMERESKCWSGEVNPNKLGYIREVA